MAYHLSKDYQVRSFKPRKKKKQYIKPKKKHVPTPKPENDICTCGCGKSFGLSRHHVFYGKGQRDLSSEYGCVEALCWQSHQSSTGIHGSKSDCKFDFELKRKHQQRLYDKGMDQSTFISLFGKDYLSIEFEDFIGR